MRFGALWVLAAAATPELLAGQASPGRIGFERFVLPNGLEVLLAPDPWTQVVAIDLWINAGSRYDPPGRGGMAHLFTQLAFAGSTHVTRGEYQVLVEEARGSYGAEVEDEVARFSETLPAERLNLGLWLEAERFRGLKLDDSVTALARDAELQAQSGSAAREAFAGPILSAATALYDSATCFGYAHLNRGTGSTLSGMNGAEVSAFYRRLYVPRNARLVIAGAFDSTEAKRLVTAFFGDLPGGEVASPPSCVPGTLVPRQIRATSSASAVPAAGLFYRVPGHGHADTPALELLGVILGQGRSARLNRSLTIKAQAAVATQAGTIAGRREDGVFALFAVAAPGVTGDSLATLLAGEARWAQGPDLGEPDLERAKTIYRATVVSMRQRPADIAELLQHAATFHGDAAAVNTDFQRYQAVTLDDVRRVARTYLTPENGVTLLVAPGSGGGGPS
jgi:predicted Zn-dependent peptidase